jgi:hypothetical protein
MISKDMAGRRRTPVLAARDPTCGRREKRWEQRSGPRPLPCLDHQLSMSPGARRRASRPASLFPPSPSHPEGTLPLSTSSSSRFPRVSSPLRGCLESGDSVWQSTVETPRGASPRRRGDAICHSPPAGASSSRAQTVLPGDAPRGVSTVRETPFETPSYESLGSAVTEGVAPAARGQGRQRRFFDR